METYIEPPVIEDLTKEQQAQFDFVKYSFNEAYLDQDFADESSGELRLVHKSFKMANEEVNYDLSDT